MCIISMSSEYHVIYMWRGCRMNEHKQNQAKNSTKLLNQGQ